MSCLATDASAPHPSQSPGRTLAIIGNAPVSSDYTMRVEGTSLVVRFNHLNNRNTGTGSRIDIWVIASHPWLLERFTSLHMASNDEPLPDIPQLEQSRTQLWFPIPPVPPAVVRRHTLPSRAQRKTAIRSFMSSVLRDFTTPTIIDFDAGFYNQLRPDTWPRECVMPSNGYLITKLLLESNQFALYEKAVLGFTWKGWIGHPWEHEKRYFRQKEASNELCVI